MFPVFPFACAAGLFASVFGLGWYRSLSKREQDETDQLASRIARQLYPATVSHVTSEQKETIDRLLGKSES